MLTNVLHLRFIHLYLRFKGGGDEERYRVEQKQYFKPRMLIAPRRRKHITDASGNIMLDTEYALVEKPGVISIGYRLSYAT